MKEYTRYPDSLTMIDILLGDYLRQISEWEADFLGSCSERLTTKKPLTEKQEAKLKDIYDAKVV